MYVLYHLENVMSWRDYRLSYVGIHLLNPVEANSHTKKKLFRIFYPVFFDEYLNAKQKKHQDGPESHLQLCETRMIRTLTADLNL